MTREEVTRKVIEIIYELQELSGEKRKQIQENTVPYNDLPGFDSLRFAEAEVMMVAVFGFEMDKVKKELLRLRKTAYNITIADIGNAVYALQK